MPAPTVQEVEGRLASVQCAVCKGRASASISGSCRPMANGGEFVRSAFTASLSTPTWSSISAPSLMCPTVYERSPVRSASTGGSLDFRATMSVRESIYFVTCGGCKRPFAEKSSLEAFE